jgi:hypothetical protein
VHHSVFDLSRGVEKKKNIQQLAWVGFFATDRPSSGDISLVHHHWYFDLL